MYTEVKEDSKIRCPARTLDEFSLLKMSLLKPLNFKRTFLLKEKENFVLLKTLFFSFMLIAF